MFLDRPLAPPPGLPPHQEMRSLYGSPRPWIALHSHSSVHFQALPLRPTVMLVVFVCSGFVMGPSSTTPTGRHRTTSLAAKAYRLLMETRSGVWTWVKDGQCCLALTVSDRLTLVVIRVAWALIMTPTSHQARSPLSCTAPLFLNQASSAQ